MAVDPLALSLADYALLEETPDRRKNIAFDMIKSGSVLSYLKAETDPTLAIQGTRYIGLPSDAIWKPLNTEPTEYKALPQPYSEQAYQFAVKMDIPVMILKNEENKRKGGGAALFDKRVKAFLKYLSYDFQTKFYKNDHLSTGLDNDPNCFVGLYGRLRDPDNKYKVPAENKIDALGLDLTTTGATLGQNVNKLIALLQQLLFSMDEPMGDNIVLSMNEALMTLIEMGIRNMGAGAGFSMTKEGDDPYNRVFLKYRHAIITTAGRRAPDNAGSQAQIITSTETANGLADTGGTFTSIIGYKTNPEDLGIKQFMELDATDPFLLENRTHMRTVVQNAYLIDQESIRSIGRIFNIKMA